MIYRFGSYTLDVFAFRLVRDGEELSVPRQVFDLIAYLIEHRERVVTRHELFDALWPGRIVTDTALSTRLKAARKVLHDTGREQSIIRTVHGRGYRFIADVQLATLDSAAPQPRHRRPKVGISLFRQLMPDSTYLAESLTDDLVTELSRFTTFQVTASPAGAGPTSANGIDEPDAQPDYILSGSISKVGEALRLNVHLTNRQSGANVWGDRFVLALADVDEQRDALVHRIAAHAAARITAREIECRRHNYDCTLSAFDHYLLGLHFDGYSERGEIWTNSHRHFEAAVALDPEFVDALAELAVSHIALGYFGPHAGGSLNAAREYATKALELDASNALAHSALTMYYLDTGQHVKAGHHVRKALECNANDIRILVQSAMFHANTCQTQSALDAANEALRLDPFHHDWVLDALGESLFHAQQYTAAIATYQRLTNVPFWIRGQLAACHAMLGDQRESNRQATAMRASLPNDYTVADEMAWALRRIGCAAGREHFVAAYRSAGLIEDGAQERPIAVPTRRGNIKPLAA